MDWLRKIPIGQFVAGQQSWLRKIDPRMKFAWVLFFLLTPVLAGPFWRISLVLSLLITTFLSCLPLRIWWRSLSLLLILSGIVGCLAILLPTSETTVSLAVRSPLELPNAVAVGNNWELIKLGPVHLGGLALGPLVIDQRSADLGLKTSTLLFTVVHSVNLMLLTTPPEELVWALRWYLYPFIFFGIPIDRISFQLLLGLRFLPLIQEEFQNLLKSLTTRAVSFKKIGFKASFALFLSVGERFLANILLRAEQGADSLLVRGGFLLPSENLRPKVLWHESASFLNIGSGSLFVVVLILRGKYGAL